MLAFGKACANTRRYDTDVPRILNYAVDKVGAELPSRAVLYDDPETSRIVLDFVKSTLPNARTDAEKHYVLSYAIYHAFLCRDYDLAGSYYKLLKEPIFPSVVGWFKSYGIQPFEWQGWLAMQAQPTAISLLQRAEGAYNQMDLTAAESIYQRLSKRSFVASTAAADLLVKHRLAAIAVERRFTKGDWVKLSDAEHKLLWITNTRGEWDPLADEVLNVVNEKNWRCRRLSKSGFNCLSKSGQRFLIFRAA